MPVYKSKEVTKDGRKWFFKCQYKDVYGETHTKKSKKYNLKSEAEEAERLFLIKNTENSDNTITFKEISKLYLEEKKKELKPQSLDKKKNLLKHINNYLGNTQIKRLTISQYKQFKDELDKKGFSNEHKNRIHRLVISLVGYANRFYGINSQVPIICGKFHDLKKIKKEMSFFTLEDFKKFEKVIDDKEWKLFFEILFYCGLRKGELQALTWNDVDFKNKTIKINKTLTTKIKGEKWTISSPKTKNSNRVLPLPTKLFNDLVKFKEESKKYIGFSDEWFVFGKIHPFTESTIYYKKEKYCDLAKVEHIRIHDFRHSCASLLINNGADITIVSRYLGHANISITLTIYTHFYEKKLQEVPKLLDKICT